MNGVEIHPATNDGAALPVRFRHIDSLRGVAAVLVAWSHFDQFVRPLAGPDPRFFAFLHTVPAFIDVGRMGVIIFFAISGFVICRSFGGPREGVARRFAIRRFCRLYPAFWVSMLCGAWMWWLKDRTLTWQVLAANATMAPALLGQEGLLGVYWTLGVELVFYALCLCLYRTRWLERPALLAGTALALTALARMFRVIDRADHAIPLSPRHVYCLGLAVMIWGALFRTVYDATGGFRRGVLAHRGTWLLVGVVVALPIVLDPKIGRYLLCLEPPGRPPTHFATAVGMGVFALWVAWLRVDYRVLTFLGVISYSVYLFHDVVRFTITYLLKSNAMVQGWHFAFWFYCVLGAVVTFALSAAVYRWVERPAIARGKRWTGSDLTPAAPRAD